MEKAANTASLRNMAPHWSLAGDKQLLHTLQDIHQKIMSRCQETNTKLEEMATALDGANIDLQNVNNKFMALSNIQFVESRVYDDDLDVTVEDAPAKPETAKTLNRTDAVGDLAKLKQSLKVLESMHESVRILNSDSDSETDDDDGRIVYKQKDLYADRPLPYIIGSQAWKSKWHAGIIPEDSDTDSSTSKPGNPISEQFSESDSEPTDTRTDRLHPPQTTIQISSSSSVADSEPSVPPAPPANQAQIAAELARKLGGNLTEVPARSPEPEFTKPHAAQTNVYKPQNPTTSTIFFDEPPPLDEMYQSDRDDYNDEEDDNDIFAELHKSKPSSNTHKDQKRLNEDLFSCLNNSHDVVDDLFGIEKEDSGKPHNYEQIVEQVKETEKKPIGGISLFGTSKGTESIGAAILKRNQHKTKSSDEESENEMFKNKHESPREIRKENVTTKKYIESSTSGSNKATDNSENVTRNFDKSLSERTLEKSEKDILQDIFSKNKPSKSKNEESYQNNNKVDLFSDNLFDDIDNIFTDDIGKVPIKEVGKNVKSIFDDEDEDDLFADIAVTSKKETSSKNTDYKAKGLFDSDNDDDLFSDTPNRSYNNVQRPSNSEVNNVTTGGNIATIDDKGTKNIFGNDSDEDIFSKAKTSSHEDIEHQIRSVDLSKNMKMSNDDDNNNLFSERSIITNKSHTEPSSKHVENNVILNRKAEQINNEETDNFSISSHDDQNVSVTHVQTTYQASELNPVLFDDQEIDDLFTGNENKIKDSEEDFTDLKHEKEIVSNDNKEIAEIMNVEPESIATSDINVNNNLIKVELDGEELAHKGQSEIKNDSVPFLSFKKDYLEEVHDQETERVNKLGSNSGYEIFGDTNLETSSLPSMSDQHSAHKSDVFSGIFNDMPPVFEKPKEPKKSKNINALFDDDSDDEALFFKKDDVISDEKPDVNSVVKDDNLFRIFSDEPPAIDVDFAQKTAISQITEPEKSKKESDLNYSDHSITQATDIIDNKVHTSLSHKQVEIDEEGDSKKTIGKLKPRNFNINVNTLLPGASPKKSKAEEEPDGHVVSTMGFDSNTNIENNESRLVKSVSFEGDADSELLNNKLSKERAKIQVKRRPSTRRARREAVKKSGVEFGSTDSTDNSSSIDDRKTTTVTESEQETTRKIVENTSLVKDVKSKVVYILNDEDIFSNVDTNLTASKTHTLNESKNLQYPDKDGTEEFNDDIFKKIKVPEVESNQTSILTKTPNVVQELSRVDIENKSSSIKTEANLEKSYKSIASIFDDMSDEEAELFHSKKPIATNNKSMFGSDSDDALFTTDSKRSTEGKDENQKATSYKVDTKKSLFDDDSDDDLFGAKTKTGNNILFSKRQEARPSHSHSVAEDPLTLLSDDEL